MASENNDPAGPIAVYDERMMEVRRRLTLYADRIEIQASWLFGRTYRMTVQLADLTPKTSTVLIRSRMLKRSIMFGALAAGAAVLSSRLGEMEWVRAVSALCWGLTAVCGVLAIRTLRKTSFVRFLRADGKPGLDIANACPQPGQFEEFVRKVKRQIRA